MALINKLNQFNFHPRIAESSGLSIVIFSAPACGACKSWKRLLRQYVKSNDVHPVTVYEIDAGIDMALANEFEVMHLPALFLYRNGHFHQSLQCETSMAHLSNAIDRALIAPAQDPP